MRMERADRIGYGVSAAAHIGLIVWAVVGTSLFPTKPSEPVEIAQVAVMTQADFNAMMAAAPRPSEQPVTTPEAPAMSETPTDMAAPDAPVPEVPPAPDAPAPEALEQPEATPEPQPDLTGLAEPLPPAEVVEVPPEMISPLVEEPSPAISLSASPRPRPKPVLRVAPEAAPAPEPDAQVSELAQPETRPAEAAPPEEATEQPRDAAAPPEATTEIVTEVTETDEEPATSAPQASPRPRPKPAPPRPAPAQAASNQPATPPRATPQSAVNAALAEALGGEGPGGAGRAATGPPITAGDKEALIVDVKACWNVGALSSEALRTTVILSVRMNPDGKPDIGSIRMIGSEGGSDAAARQAYEAGRRAIVRCGSDGFPLPPEKYAQWETIEIVFDPNRMRMK